MKSNIITIDAHLIRLDETLKKSLKIWHKAQNPFPLVNLKQPHEGNQFH